MQVLGHRGWPTPTSPENTLAAVTAALDGGCDGVEVDVRLTADGIAVCCHDDDLARVGADVRSVRRTTGAALAAAPLPGGHRVPRLDEVAAVVRGRGLLVLDLKPEPRGAALLHAGLQALELAGTPDEEVVVTSFDETLLGLLAEHRPRLARGVILDVDDPLAPAVRRAERRGDAALHLPVRTMLEQAAAVRDAALPARVWTVNRPVDARRCAAAGAVGVISDVPGTLAAALQVAAVAA